MSSDTYGFDLRFAHQEYRPPVEFVPRFFSNDTVRDLIEQGMRSICKANPGKVEFGWVELLNYIVGVATYWKKDRFDRYSLYHQMVLEIETANREYIRGNVDIFTVDEERAIVKIERKFFES